jgi:Tol biopolymer transport system component
MNFPRLVSVSRRIDRSWSRCVLAKVPLMVCAAFGVLCTTTAATGIGGSSFGSASHRKGADSIGKDNYPVATGVLGRHNGLIAFDLQIKDAADHFSFGGIYAITTRGTGRRWISRTGWGPAWSPNGRQIAYTAQVPQGFAIFIADADGRHKNSVVSPRRKYEFNQDPTWSPDGKKLAYYEQGAPGFLRVLDLQSKRNRPILNEYVQHPSWSPTGNRIAFSKAADLGIYIVNSDGTNLQKLPGKLAELGTDPEWSPDSRQILFECGGLCLMNADGSNQREVGLFGAGYAWSPDGTKFAASGGQSVWIYDLKTEKKRVIKVLRNKAAFAGELDWQSRR